MSTRPPSPIDLCTLADVKEYLNIASSTSDDLLQMLLTAASQFIMSYTNRIFQVGTYTENRNGLGINQMMALYYPLISVTSVTVNGQPVPAALTSPPTGYTFSAWSISLHGAYGFFRGSKNVQLVYTAGYATIPADISEACVELTALKFKQKDRIGISGSEGIDGQTITYRDISMSAATRQTLTQYKRVIQIEQ